MGQKGCFQIVQEAERKLLFVVYQENCNLKLFLLGNYSYLYQKMVKSDSQAFSPSGTKHV
ncbi:hypothetical protein HanIR_Chr17g0872531 [Helianthus annuus]|nr:hypothetical protein HanIR_Chr17g0872531 [Helianthus annuus]